MSDTKEKRRELMIRCPKCKQENYMLNVSAGICTWCGFENPFIEEPENKIE